jgi:hypothetical protein
LVVEHAPTLPSSTLATRGLLKLIEGGKELVCVLFLLLALDVEQRGGSCGILGLRLEGQAE